MKLFTKPGCGKCDYVKKYMPDEAPVQIYDISTREGLAELAWCQLVRTAEKELPILVARDGHAITGSIQVVKHLKDYC
jgi:hypothetical protein